MTNNSLLDQLKGAASKDKGVVLEQIGKATDNKKLQAEGRFEKAKNEAQGKMTEVKDRLHDKIR